MNIHRWRRGSGAVAISLYLGVAGAQESAPQESWGLEEVVVTAQRREQNVQDVPISIAAFGTAQISQLGATSLQNIEAATPNLSFGTGGRASRGEIGIRGVSDYARNIGNDARVGVYVDGVYQGRSYATDPDLVGVERIEVLRGPQGTLFGRNTVAGAINITTRKPDGSFGAEAEAEIGNFDLRRFAGRVDLPLASDVAALSVMLGHTKRDGFITNIVNGTKLNGADRTTGRATLRLTPGDSLEILVSGDILQEKIASEGEQATSGPGFTLAPDPFQVAHDANGTDERDIKGIAGTVNYTFDNQFVLTSVSAYREAMYETLGIEEDYSPLFVGVSHYDESSEQFSQELRLASPAGNRYDFVAGLYYMNQKLQTHRYALTGPYFPIAPNSSVAAPGKLDVESVAAFLNSNYRVTDRLELSGGVRWTREEKKVVHSVHDTTGVFTNFTNFRDELADTDVSPRIGLNFHLDQDVLLYATAARAFKSGGWNADFVSTLDQIKFEDEQATNYEAGIKATWFDRRVRTNIAAFHMKYDDFQVFQFVPLASGGTLITITNAGKVTSEGFEAELVVRPVAGLTLTGTGAYTKARFDRFKDGGGTGIHFDGNRLPFAPETTFYASAEYTLPLGHLGQLVAFADYSYNDGYFTHSDNAPANQIDSFDLVGARLSFITADDRFELSLWGKNLTDETYFRSRSRSFLGVERAVVEMPRTYGVRARVKF